MGLQLYSCGEVYKFKHEAGMKLRKLNIFFALNLIFIFSFPSKIFSATIDAQIAAEEKKRNELTRQIQDYKNQIRKMGSQVESLLNKVNTLQQDEGYAEQELKVLELQNEKIIEDIAALESHMGKEQIKINDLSERMRDRIVDMYKYGSTGQMRTLFASRSVFEAVDDTYLLEIISKRDGEILAGLQESMRNMDINREIMKNLNKMLREKSEAVQDQKNKYHQSVRDTNAFINSLRRKRELAENAAREAEQAQREATKMIAELQKRKSRDYFGKGRGSTFDWPVKGAISSYYGYRNHPILKRKILHAGIDIVGAIGDPVRTGAPGEVIYNGWLRGYGRVVVLNHGRGLSTLYAHLSASLVQEGQEVKAGAVIARVGKTGNTTGPHLHFEVRKYGTPTEPLNYLKKK